ncbi:MAG: helix-turn-helix domain-containing protein [Elsteraceae bacterium]
MAELRSGPDHSAQAQESASDHAGALAANLRRLRRERGLTLDGLAAASGVSRAMLSKVERGASVPTATVLGKIAGGLEVGLSQLVGPLRERAPALLGPEEQPVYRDPETGFERRSLSPLFPDRRVDFARNFLPPGAAAIFPPHRRGVEEYLYVVSGSLIVVVDGARHAVGPGSSLYYPGHVAHEFRNESDAPTVFFVVIDSAATL